MSRRAATASIALGAAAAAHLAPALLTLGPVRVRAAPGLAGIGRPDHFAMTFDDGPDLTSTPAVLDALDRLGWKATFFLLGSMVRTAGSLPAGIVAEGHEVAVHGDRHRSHLWRTLPGAVADVRRARDAVVAATGVEPRWFRPPYGTLSAPALAAGRRAGLRTVLWTAWGRDWREQATPESIVDDVVAGWRPGATVLLHDSDCTSAPGSWKRTVDALPRLADAFAARGLTVGPLRDHGLG
jgi:peptidoglycan/xylan/chitin deacetylase (PgdA/CDA1 family)